MGVFVKSCWSTLLEVPRRASQAAIRTRARSHALRGNVQRDALRHAPAHNLSIDLAAVAQFLGDACHLSVIRDAERRKNPRSFPRSEAVKK